MGNAGELDRRRVPHRPRAAGRVRRQQPSQGRRGDGRRTLHGRDPAGGDSAEEGATPVARVDRDESVRAGHHRRRRLRALRPAFKKDGTVTAGNAPPVNDGAAALVVMSAARAAQLGLTPMARIVGQATSGLAPKYLLMTPVEAVRASAAEGRLDARGGRSVRDQRSVLGAGRRGAAGSRHRSRARSTSTAARWRSAIRSAPAARAS